MPKRAKNRFQELVGDVGYEIALYCFCAVRDLEYKPEIKVQNFPEYAAKVEKEFRFGDMNVQHAFDKSLSDIEKWQMVWGIGDENKPYTVEDYKRLDKLFDTYSSRLQKAGGMDAVQDDTLRVCSKMRLEADKALARGGKDNISIASQLNKMIQDNLSSEQLRKKDSRPAETARLDGIVEAIAKKYGVSVELSYDEAIEICSKWLANQRYNMTMDAAEHMLLAIINTTRSNDDMPEIKTLPKKARFDMTYASQFDDEPNELEREAYEYLDIKRGELEG